MYIDHLMESEGKVESNKKHHSYLGLIYSPHASLFPFPHPENPPRQAPKANREQQPKKNPFFPFIRSQADNNILHYPPSLPLPLPSSSPLHRLLITFSLYIRGREIRQERERNVLLSMGPTYLCK